MATGEEGIIRNCEHPNVTQQIRHLKKGRLYLER